MNTADGLVEAALSTISLAGAQPAGTPLERVVNLPAGGEGVLVLDNCQQISGAAYGVTVVRAFPRWSAEVAGGVGVADGGLVIDADHGGQMQGIGAAGQSR
ncbi:hypothetical protein SAMN05444920_14229 [Nonomuraea solani]|uniref:Uncharacterized protein n=1 Tax=Nonomuraea solani TaxID=1144553 RepID=A0A1H6F2V3_9ACTN|nr:hypothetical protein [Nonomuraea solani]SEH03711.1 hypothetical protein SAMN05444920_14229 [Nonomuraea solani]